MTELSSVSEAILSGGEYLLLFVEVTHDNKTLLLYFYLVGGERLKVKHYPLVVGPTVKTKPALL